MAEVILDHLTKRFDGGTVAVDDVSLTVAHGEFMVLLGPSGCGKSTTLRMVAGLETITEGTLKIGGRMVNDVPAKDRDIAMVFQSYALYPHMSVRDNLAFGLRRRNFQRAEIDRRVTDVSKTLGLSELLERKPYQLSGGQRQRVALGRAIVRDPAVFLFDEPLSNLDAGLRVFMRVELAKLHHRLGATMIYVTHDQVEAMTMGTRICIMNGGKVVQVGAPLDVYRHPANTFVASFLGSPPTNLLAARLNGGLQLGQTTLPLDGMLAKRAARANGPNVVFGIRPEDVTVGPGPLEAHVVTVEPLGAETILAVRLPGIDQDLMVRASRDTTATVGDRLSLGFDLAAALLFESGTGQAIP
jgi:multiple sugar transport system ATP-binding protein